MNSTGGRMIMTSRELYRHLLRECEKLPQKSQQEHYKHHVRQGFNSHLDEADPTRIQQIIKRALEDAAWILSKYTKPKS